MLAAAACGGGGGGGGGGGSVGPPTAAPTNSSYRPAAAGDTFTYTGTLTQTFVRAPLSGSPVPSPNPTNSSTLQYAVTQQVSVTATADPNGVSASARSYDFHTVETDVASLETLTTTSDSILAYVPSGASTDVEQISTSESSGDYAPDNTQYATSYGSGNGLLDVIPESGTGQIGARNSAALSQTETDPDGQVTQRNVNADGSYTENVTYPNGTSFPGGGATTATASEASDGSGSYNFPLAGYELNGVGTVVSVPTPSGTTVTITVTIPAALSGPSPGPTPLVTSEPVTLWYTNPPQLSRETYVDNGPAALPAGCTSAATLLAGRSTNQLVQTISTVDTIFGESESEVRTSYTATGLGVVCFVLNDIALQYYDFSGQTRYALYFASTPVQTTTTTETLVMSQASVAGLTAVARRTDAVSPAESGYAFDAGFQSLLERARNRRHAARVRTMKGPLVW
jgi:hypothetical protein